MRKVILSVIALSAVLFSCKRGDEGNKDGEMTSKYTYESVEGDPTKTRIYTLDNGLKVYLSVYNDAPRIQTYIPVRAGSKNDPADATGLAHYLEHLMFKGTSKIGSLDWEKEKVLLDEIEALYEEYRGVTDPEKRKEIYAKIDEVSGRAAKLAAANEYDKMVSNIGAKGTNAFTSFDQTVYVNDIPSNQLEKWLKLESERFQEIVPRLFHTELEAVYEEKNRGLDDDGSKVFETAFAELFPTHPYGTQTTIGTIEHLKNPSIVKIKDYFNKNYVPNNMAICLAGDLDPDQTIAWVDKYFGGMERKEMEPYTVNEVKPLAENIEKTVYGPDAENLMLCYQLPHLKHSDVPALQLMNQMLYNGQAGLMDVNLNQKQKVLGAGTYQYLLKDHSVQLFVANAREGQDLKEVRDLITEQVESLKAGQFEDWMLNAAINNLKISEMRGMESNRGRAGNMMDAYINEVDWADQVNSLKKLEGVTKEDIVNVANKYFNNYVCIYKKTGEDPNSVTVEKPQITQVEVNRDSTSAYYKNLMEMEASQVKPAFLDYSQIDKKDVNGVSFMHKMNEDNDIFNLYYLVDMGKNHDPKLAMAVEYLQYLGTDKYSLEELNKEFYKLGSSYRVFTSDDQVYVRLTGLQDSFEESLKLFEHLLSNAKGDEMALNMLKAGEMKKRADAKLDKNTILRRGLLNYAFYGQQNPFNNVLTDQQLAEANVEEMIGLINGMMSYEHNVMYYGPSDMASVEPMIAQHHKVPAELQPLPADDKFQMQDINEPTVYWAHYDMVQAEIMFLSKSIKFDPAIDPEVKIYNEYFGGGMGAIVFQDMREAKALAYSVYSVYSNARKKDKNNIIQSYIGTQSDKLPEAMKGMIELLDNMPESELAFENSKTAIKNKIETERITKSRVIFNYLDAQKLGVDTDIRKNLYDKVDGMKYEDIKKFQEQYVKGQPRNVIVIGSKERLNFDELEKYGKLQEVSLEELFGY